MLLEKVAGPENPTDCLTNYASGPEIARHLKTICLEIEAGRAQSAPQLTTAVSEDMHASKEVIREERARVLLPQTPRNLSQTESVSAAATMCSPKDVYVPCTQCSTLQVVSSPSCGVCEAQMHRARAGCPMPRAVEENLPGHVSQAGQCKVSTPARSGQQPQSQCPPFAPRD